MVSAVVPPWALNRKFKPAMCIKHSFAAVVIIESLANMSPAACASRQKKERCGFPTIMDPSRNILLVGNRQYPNRILISEMSYLFSCASIYNVSLRLRLGIVSGRIIRYSITLPSALRQRVWVILVKCTRACTLTVLTLRIQYPCIDP